ncbi:MAG: hypothetical protein ACQEXJ_18975 [Myxococcota bacterium]
MARRTWKTGWCVGLVVALATAAGCSGMMNRQTGKLMSGFAVEHMVPYMMTTDDVGMACETGVSMGAFLLSYGRVVDEPHLAAIGTLLPAGLCAEEEAVAAELAYHRALRQGDPEGAQDARIVQKRAHALAARRYHRAWNHWTEAFGRADESCPDLEEEEEVPFLLGLLAGANAVMHDRAASGAVGVPLDVPRKAARASRCLDDETWWGVPSALRAAVWVGVPGAAPKDADPWDVLTKAAATGREAGVLLAGALRIQTLAGVSREDELREAIRTFADAHAAGDGAEDWTLLNENARWYVQVVSDRMWTRATGHRTPWQGLGTFWDDQALDEGGDDLLEGLVDEEEEGAGQTGEEE